MTSTNNITILHETKFHLKTANLFANENSFCFSIAKMYKKKITFESVSVNHVPMNMSMF